MWQHGTFIATLLLSQHALHVAAKSEARRPASDPDGDERSLSRALLSRRRSGCRTGCPKIGERDGAVEFTVELSAASSGTVTVYYFVYGGTATAHVDFRPEWGSVAFAPDETSKTVRVPLIDDRAGGEGAETFNLSLRLTDTAHATLADNQAQGTITDND